MNTPDQSNTENTSSCDSHYLVQFKLPNTKIKKMIFKRDATIHEIKKILLQKIKLPDSVDRNKIQCLIYIDDPVISNVHYNDHKYNLIDLLNDPTMGIYKLFQKNILTHNCILNITLDIRSDDLSWLTKSTSKVERKTSFGLGNGLSGIPTIISTVFNGINIASSSIPQTSYNTGMSFINSYGKQNTYDNNNNNNNSGEGLVYDWGPDDSSDNNDFIVW